MSQLSPPAEPSPSIGDLHYLRGGAHMEVLETTPPCTCAHLGMGNKSVTPINNGKSKCPAEVAPYCSASGEMEENSVPMRSGTVGLITHQF